MTLLEILFGLSFSNEQSLNELTRHSASPGKTELEHLSGEDTAKLEALNLTWPPVDELLTVTVGSYGRETLPSRATFAVPMRLDQSRRTDGWACAWPVREEGCE